jgi:hypothetical protein
MLLTEMSDDTQQEGCIAVRYASGTHRYALYAPVRTEQFADEPVHGGCDVQDRTKASIVHDAGDSNIFFPVSGCICAQHSRAPKGSTREPTTFKVQ